MLIQKTFSARPSNFSGLCGLCIVLLGSGCATTLPGSVSGPVRESKPPVLAHFVARGKLSIRPGTAAEAVGARGFSAQYRWQQAAAQYDIELWGLLGQGRTKLRGDAQHIDFIDGSGQRTAGGVPEQLMQTQLGWSLPLAVVPYWLQGELAPGATNWASSSATRSARGDLVAARQLGWQLKFDRYRQVGKRRLPGRVRGHNAELRVTILVRDWQI